jgi:hypothetical protein
VQVHDRLAGGGAVVDADVEAVGHRLDPGLGTWDSGLTGCLLFPGRFEEGGDVTFRDDEGVAGGDGEGVGNGVGVGVGQDDPGVVRGAEGAEKVREFTLVRPQKDLSESDAVVQGVVAASGELVDVGGIDDGAGGPQGKGMGGKGAGFAEKPAPYFSTR